MSDTWWFSRWNLQVASGHHPGRCGWLLLGDSSRQGDAVVVMVVTGCEGGRNGVDQFLFDGWWLMVDEQQLTDACCFVGFVHNDYWLLLLVKQQLTDGC